MYVDVNGVEVTLLQTKADFFFRKCNFCDEMNN